MVTAQFETREAPGGIRVELRVPLFLCDDLVNSSEQMERGIMARKSNEQRMASPSPTSFLPHKIVLGESVENVDKLQSFHGPELARTAQLGQQSLSFGSLECGNCSRSV